VRGGEGYFAMNSGGDLAGEFRVGDRYLVSSTTEQLIPLGEFSIPPAFPGNDAVGIDFSAIRIEAEKVSGSGNLVMSKIILIPALEGYLHVRLDRGVSAISPRYETLTIFHKPNGDAAGTVTNATDDMVLEVAHPELHEWGLPFGIEAGVVVVFAANADASLASQLDVTLKARRRYATLRGAA
jgi:hypothetical protein